MDQYFYPCTVATEELDNDESKYEIRLGEAIA